MRWRHCLALDLEVEREIVAGRLVSVTGRLHRPSGIYAVFPHARHLPFARAALDRDAACWAVAA